MASVTAATSAAPAVITKAANRTPERASTAAAATATTKAQAEAGESPDTVTRVPDDDVATSAAGAGGAASPCFARAAVDWRARSDAHVPDAVIASSDTPLDAARKRAGVAAQRQQRRMHVYTALRSMCHVLEDRRRRAFVTWRAHSRRALHEQKRAGDVLSWDETFMALVSVISRRSKDPRTRVGAVIVNEHNHVVALGYNGFPVGVDDDEFPWCRTPYDDPLDRKPTPDNDMWLHTKHPYVCHAEVNAVLNKNSESTRGSKLYVGLFPCHECAKVVIQAGIREVVYCLDKNLKSPSGQASMRMFRAAGVVLRRYTGRQAEVVVKDRGEASAYGGHASGGGKARASASAIAAGGVE